MEEKKNNLIHDMDYMLSVLQEVHSKLNITKKKLQKDLIVEEITVAYFASYGKMLTDIAHNLDEYITEKN